MQYIVGVNHQPNGKTYYFKISEDLHHFVRKGSKVLCNTKFGINPGIVVTNPVPDNSDDGRSILEQNNLTPDAMKSICCVERMMPLINIDIPHYMQNTAPSLEKIASRLVEWYVHRAFDTPVLISTDFTLLDGYTAYLAARSMEHFAGNHPCEIRCYVTDAKTRKEAKHIASQY